MNTIIMKMNKQLQTSLINNICKQIIKIDKLMTQIYQIILIINQSTTKIIILLSMHHQIKTLQLIISGRYGTNKNDSTDTKQVKSHHERVSSLFAQSEQSHKSTNITFKLRNKLVTNKFTQIQPQFHQQKSSKIIDYQKKELQGGSRKSFNNDIESENTVQYIQREKQAIQNLKDKYRTFVGFDFKKSLPKIIKPSQHRKSPQQSIKNKVKHLSSTSMKFSVLIHDSDNTKKKSNTGKLSKHIAINSEQNSKTNLKVKNQIEIERQQQKQKQKQKQKYKYKSDRTGEGQLTQQMLAVKQNRRQRFEKQPNPTFFLKHYIQKQNFTATFEEKRLIQKLVGIQKSIEKEKSTNNKSSGLETVIQNLYELMNMAVDYNELLFLALVICLAGDVCFFLRDFPRAFYFYNQARIAGSYSKMDKLKIPALMGLGRICFELQYFEESQRIIRKSLQYAWRSGDESVEVEVYDSYGQIYNQLGKIKLSMFYHNKFAKKIIQPNTSALKKISREMLQEYDRHIQSMQTLNLDTLFLQYIHLPLNKSFDNQRNGKIFKNYSLNQSPRMLKQTNDFSRQSFPDIKFQLTHLLEQDYQFKTEIPDPDKPASRQLNRLFKKQPQNSESSINHKRELDFERSIEFNRIMNKKPQKPNIQKQLKRSLDEKVQTMIKQKMDPKWYGHMVAEIKKKRIQKMGDLKERIRNSHLSYSKYPKEKKKTLIWSVEKINESFNRTLLNWIDPV